MNEYYDKARYNSLVARESITRWNITRQGELALLSEVFAHTSSTLTCRVLHGFIELWTRELTLALGGLSK